jgi:uracil phosphoribosyltransferase
LWFFLFTWSHHLLPLSVYSSPPLVGLNYLPFNKVTINTPTGDVYEGVEFASKICGVSIVRAGESMETGLRAVCKSVRIGKILIQRDERTAQPKLYYAKFPDDIKDRKVLLLDPMLATGGSAIRAVEVLIENGVPEANILFMNLIAAPEGVHALLGKFPTMQIITTEVDARLDERKFILPGVGDFGDR